MGLETGTYINDLVSTNPPSSDKKSQGDDHIRLLKSVLKTTFPNASKAFYFPTVLAKTAAYTVLSTDNNVLFTADASAAAFSLTLPTLTASDDGWMIRVVKISAGSNAVTLVGTINGQTNYVLTSQYSSVVIYWDGSAWYAISENEIYALQQLSAPATGDAFRVYDISANAQKYIVLSDLLTILNSLTEDTSPDRTADFVMTYDTSASAVKKVELQNLPGKLARGYIDGFIVSNNGTDPTNDIDIQYGVARDHLNTFDIIMNSSLTGKQLDANWAAGSSAGIRYSGAGIADTTYHIYAVSKADGTADAYAYPATAGTDPSDSTFIASVLTALQAETGGADYAYIRYVWSIVRLSSAIVLFTQVGDYGFIKTPVQVGSSCTTTSANYTLTTVPLGIRALVHMNITGNISGGLIVYVRCPDDTDMTPSGTVAPGASIGDGGSSATQGNPLTVRTDRSAQVAARSSSGTPSFHMNPLWYMNERGRNV